MIQTKRTWSVLLIGAALLGGCSANASNPGEQPLSSTHPTYTSAPSPSVTSLPTVSPSPAANESIKPGPVSDSLSSVSIQQQVLKRLKKSGAVLPRTIPLDKGQKLAASIEQNSAKGYEVVFYGASKQLPVDDSSLKPDGKIPVAATFTARGKDAERDKELFAPVDFSQWPKEQIVDLGHGIKGYPEGAAGSQYLSWKEGRWTLQIRSTSEDKLDNAAIARKIVAFLEKNSLPVPKENGKISIDYRPGGKKVEVGIYWQNGNTVYELETSRVPIDALTMAVSVK
ncbi:hypothetical protein M3223_10510 [Paenibacillus pasadenensis]|uniref:hypothetical protein n=1 Tax=Paenibacillus pasadenensis TaxID=217090 RepID=UPI002041F7CD|nr:hypothetical protein [Paenibacillus pasadenensis]MCM3747789.1 hypothetical protein [Paenibacillus pasadenensis]